MIIAGLVDISTKDAIGRVYLAETPFPGDTVTIGNDPVTVIRRTFLDLGPDYDSSSPVVSVFLEVRLP